MSNLDTLKIAYVNFSKYPARNIEKKIDAMAVGARSAGICRFDFWYINGEKTDRTGIVKYIRFPNSHSPMNIPRFFFQRYNLIQKSFDFDKYDYVILRYCGGDPTGLNFFSKYSIISEHQTLEEAEYLSHLSTSPPLYEYVAKCLRLNLERRYGPEMLKRAKGIIGVTNEISYYESERVGYLIPSETISNGISVEQVPKTGFQMFDGKNLDMVVLASVNDPWHGVDRLVRSMAIYNGPVNIRLHIVGRISHKGYLSDLKGANIQFHGYKTGEELDKIIREMNLGIGTLSLYRKGMQQACALKTREYTARGLPFILAYIDPDLHFVDKQLGFFLRLTNNASVINMERIIDFAKYASSVSNLSDYMREYAKQYMDWSAKMQSYKRFVQRLAQSRRASNASGRKIE